MTLAGFIDYFKTQFGAGDVSMISCGSALLYAQFSKPAIKRERLPMVLEALVPHVSKTPLGAHVRFLNFEINAVDADGEELGPFPVIRYRIPDTAGTEVRTTARAQPSCISPALANDQKMGAGASGGDTEM
jgi:hypothetical protein